MAPPPIFLLPLTPSEVAYWDTEITHIAQHWVQKWACHQDAAPLVEDMTMAGWIAVLEFGPEHPRVRWEIQNGMQEALCLWLYGVGRRSHLWTRRLTIGTTRPARYDRTRHQANRSVAETAMRRVGIERLWSRLKATSHVGRPHKARQVLRLMWNNSPSGKVTARAAAAAHVGNRALLNGKRRIRQMAEALELQE